MKGPAWRSASLQRQLNLRLREGSNRVVGVGTVEGAAPLFSGECRSVGAVMYRAMSIFI